MADQWASAPELHGELAEARADTEYWKARQQRTAADLVSMTSELNDATVVLAALEAERDAARAEVAALREQVTAMEQHWTCQRCGQKPIWTECGNARCKVKVHPYCACDRDDEVDGHWCDEGCPCEVLADLRAKVEALHHDGLCSVTAQMGSCDCLRGEVLALLDEVQP